MKYTVVWHRIAEYDLGQRWVDADSYQRHRITSAMSVIEDALRHRPLLVGEIRTPRTRTLVVTPVEVNYTVRNDDRVVEVVAIHFQ